MSTKEVRVPDRPSHRMAFVQNNLSNVTPSLLKTPLVSLVILFVLLTMFETISRASWSTPYLPPPHISGWYAQETEIKFLLLDDLIAAEGPTDCFFIGSSMVDSGVSPEVFSRGFFAHVHNPARCYNLGLIGVNIGDGLDDIAHYLAYKYHAKYIVVGTSVQDYKSDCELPCSVEQYLAEESYSYHRYKTILTWLDPAFISIAQKHTPEQLEYSSYGQQLRRTTLQNIGVVPEADDPKEQALRDYLATYSISPRQLANLERLLSFQHNGLKVIVVEMPTHPTYLNFLQHGEQDYSQFLFEVKRIADRYGVVFWQLDPSLQIPSEGWYDRNHLNVIGAEVFSNWLGKSLGEISR